MGALEYRPALLDEDDVSERVTVEALSELADRVLQMREDAKAALIPGMNEYSSILKVGSSAGGARAKAIIGWNEETGEVRSGQVKLPEGFGYWLIKFDGGRRQVGLRARRIRLPPDGARGGHQDVGMPTLEQAPLYDAPLRPSRGRRQTPHADARRNGAP